MALVLNGLSEQAISTVEAIQDSHHTKVLVELEVVIVVCFWGWEERKVVATVSNGCGEESQTEPEGCCGYM